MLKKMIGIATIGACALLSGCKADPHIAERTRKYMADKPIQEFEQVIKGFHNADRYQPVHQNLQSRLDSVAFRDVLNGTNAVKDSTKVAEFNKIASANRYRSVTEGLKNTEISVKEYDKIIKDGRDMSWQFKKLGEPFNEHVQFKTDSIQYRKFFEKHKLLDKKTLSHFNNVCKKIKP